MNEAQVHALRLLAEGYDYGRGSLHAHKVADLATSIFDQLRNCGLLPGFTIDDRRTLAAMGYAHEIGASPQAQQETSGLPDPALTVNGGLDRNGETTFLSLRARLNEASSDPGLTSLAPEDRSALLYCLLWCATSTACVLDIEPLIDRRKTLLLAGILRVADGLDYRLRLRVREVKVQRASAWLRFLVRSVAPATEEVARAQDRSEMLSQALSLRIFVQEVI